MLDNDLILGDNGKLTPRDRGISVNDADTFACVNMLGVPTGYRTRQHRRAIFDSGATHSLHHQLGLFTNRHTPVVTAVRGIGDHRTTIVTAGSVGGLDGVLHMPSCTQPVIAVGAFLDQVGGSLEFTPKELYLTRKQRQAFASGKA